MRLDDPRIVGRVHELERGLELLERSSRGRLQVLLVRGEAGIGKSRFLDELLRAASEAEFSVFRGAADEIERRRPFRMILDALDVRAHRDDPPRRRILQLLSEGTGSGAEDSGDPSFVIAEQLLHLVEGEAIRRSTVLALEDIHWADAASLEVAAVITRRLGDLPLLLACTLRPGHSSRHLESFLDNQLQNGASFLPLPPLSDEEVRELAAALIGGTPGVNLWAQVRRAGGNPLFVRELIAALDEEGGLLPTDAGMDVADARLPPLLRDTIVRRLRFLSRETLEILRVGAIFGSSFAPRDVSELMGRPTASLLGRIDEAVESAVLAERGSRFEFRHGLIREVIYEGLPPPLRAALHLDAARALRRMGAALDEVVPHLLQGVTPGDEDGIELLAEAAFSARNKAPAVAVELLERLVELVPTDDRRRLECEAALVRPLGRLGRFADAEYLARSLLVVPRPPSLDRWIREGLQIALVRQGKLAACRQELETVLAGEVADESQRIMWMSYLANMCLLTGNVPDARAHSEKALHAATSAGDEEMVVYNLATLSWIDLADGYVPLGVERASEAVARHERITSNPQNVFIYWGVVLMQADRLDEAIEAFQTGARRDAAVGDVSVLPVYQWCLAAANFFSGRWDNAGAEIEAGKDLASNVAVPGPAILTAHAVEGLIALHRNDLAAARRHVDAGQAQFRELGPQAGVDLLWWAQASLLEAEGRTQEALEALEASWELTSAMRYFLSWRMVAPSLVRLSLARGDHDTAAAVTAEAEEGARRAGGTPSATAAALTCTGLLDRAPERLREAACEWARSGRVLEEASALEYAAAASSARGQRDDAVELWRDASLRYERLGAARDLDRVHSELRAHGARPRRGGRRPTDNAGWASLTETEQRVARLVSEGLTNREVADRLYISRYTVDTHLRHVFGKLGLSSRVELPPVVLKLSSEDRS